mgnify:CR=1 FL=1
MDTHQKNNQSNQYDKSESLYRNDSQADSLTQRDNEDVNGLITYQRNFIL